MRSVSCAQCERLCSAETGCNYYSCNDNGMCNLHLVSNCDTASGNLNLYSWTAADREAVAVTDPVGRRLHGGTAGSPPLENSTNPVELKQNGGGRKDSCCGRRIANP